MALNIPPVTGMTPAEVAKELRVLVKKHFVGLNTAGDDYVHQNWNTLMANLENVSEAIVLLDNRLGEIVENAKRRRPSETRTNVELLRNGPLSTIKLYVMHSKNRARDIKPGASKGANEERIHRLYALVQALPTVEQAPVGKAENTVRAITAILKVHYGIDVDKSPEHLPDIMAELLKQITQAKSPVEEKPKGQKIDFTVVDEVASFSEKKPEKKLSGPYSVHADIKLDNFHFKDNVHPTPVFEEEGYGSTAGWNNGDCTYNEAIQAFIWIRNRYYNTNVLTLKFGTAIVAIARKNKPIEYVWSPVGGIATDETMALAPTIEGGDHAESEDEDADDF